MTCEQDANRADETRAREARETADGAEQTTAKTAFRETKHNMTGTSDINRKQPKKRQKKGNLPFSGAFAHQDSPEESQAKRAAAASSAEAVMDAFERMNETTTASFKASEELPSLQGSKSKSNVDLAGLYGDAFLSAKPSSELMEKERERQKREHEGEDYEARLGVLEHGLCEKFGIVPPVKRPNRRQDRGESGEEILVLGQTVNDRKHPKLWGIRQEDRTRHTYLIGGTGSGKCQSNSSKVLCIDGWKRIGDIEVGDKIYNRYGKLTDVTHVFHQNEKKQVWEVEFANGIVLEACSEHHWVVVRNVHGGYKEVVKTTKELYDEGLKTHLTCKTQGYKNGVPICKPVEFPEQKLPIAPYALGCLIGDGYTASQGNYVYMSSADEEILSRMVKALGPDYSYKKQCPDNDSHYSWYILEGERKSTAPKLKEQLRLLNLACTTTGKFIPPIYLNASIEQRRELLKGLMDTDGTAHARRIAFYTINERLKNDFLYLVRSLGYDAHASLDNRPEKYATGACWCISVLSNDVENIFHLQRKKDDVYNYRVNRSQNLVKTYEMKPPLDYENGTTNLESLPIPPITYGVLALYGGYTNIRVPRLSEDMRNRIREELPTVQFADKCNSGGDYVTISVPPENPIRPNYGNTLKDPMMDLGWKRKTKEKYIDPRYLRLPIAERKNMLRAMIALHFHAHSKHLEFSTSSPEMLSNMVELIESCGYTIRVDTLKNNTSKTINLLNPDEDLIWNEEQLNTLRANGAFDNDGMRGTRNSEIAIVDIRPTDRYEDMTCITVAEGETYITEGFIVTHNSTLLHAIGVEDMWYYRGGLIIEPHGDLSYQLLKAAPPYRIHDIIYLNVLDPIASPGFNPLELPLNPTDDDRQEVVGAVTSLIAKHFNMDTGYVKLLKMLTNALNAMSYVPGITLLELMDFYSNEDIRESILSFVPDGPQKDNMRDLAQNAKPDDLASLDNRISRFTTNRYMRHLFGQSNTTVDLYDLMNQGAYIISPIPKGATKDDVFIKFYGSYIVSEVYKAAVMREAIPENDRVNFALTLDECQNFLGGSGSGSADAEGILSEARKYGLQMMLANQYLAQLSNDLKAAIMQNCATKMCYAMQSADATEMAKAMGVSAQDLMSIPKYHVMASPLVRGGNVTPFISAVFPPISLKSDVSDITAELIAENSRNKYMKKRDEIEDEIADRRERLVSGNKEAIMALVKKKNR